MVHHKECPLCRSGEISPELSCSDHFLSKEVFSLYRCKNCGFLFTQDYPGEPEIGKYYESEEYISHSNTSKGLVNKLYMLVRSYMLRKKRKLVSHVCGLSSGTILDIGSGTGYFASVMKEAGWNVRGIEINEKARNFSAENFDIDVTDPAEIDKLESNSFDCITLWHVLEHFQDPFRISEQISRLLKPTGKCIIALPNSASYDASHYGPYWAAWDVPRHLWHFDTDTFRQFATKAGFHLEKLKTLPPDVFYISQLSEKYKGTAMPFLTGIVRATGFAILSAFRKRKSSSIIYILNKL